MNYLKTNMFAHQEKAFSKIKNLKAYALFMDMGTGKTRTILEYIQFKINQGKINRVFWLCPCSTKRNLKEDGMLMIAHSDSREFLNNLHGNADERIQESILMEINEQKNVFINAGLNVVEAFENNEMYYVIIKNN